MLRNDNDRNIYTMFLSSNASINLNGEYLVIVDNKIKILDDDFFFTWTRLAFHKLQKASRGVSICSRHCH